MSVDWGKVAKDFWDAQPHPRGHGLTIGEFATAVKLATMAKFGGHAEPHEAALFWQEFRTSGLTPQEFEHGLDTLAPLSFTYHGRPPSLNEIVNLKDKAPHEARRYFGDLPDKHYPSVSAENMVKALAAADPHAREHLQRPPVKLEAAYLHHSGEQPSIYYARLASQAATREPKMTSSNVVPLEVGRVAGGRGPTATRGQAPDQ
jgi:hypothetical protein